MSRNGTPAERGPRHRLSDEVAERLERAIVSGEYPVDTKLPNEKTLAEEFGVGRSSMREAVRTLQAAGYLRSAHGVGVFVISSRPTTVGAVEHSLVGGYTMSDLFEARVAIEGQTAALAAQRVTSHHRERLQSIIRSASDTGVDEAAFVALDAAFHRQVADASGNPLLLHMWESIAVQFEEYSMRVISLPGRLQRAHEDHAGIARAIIARDGELAARLAREHVLAVQEELQSDEL